jgi:hypothetical protein
MANERTADGGSRIPARQGAARFWVPFLAMVALFSALAIAYAVDGSPHAAPGAIRQGTSSDAPSHGLEPTTAH